MPANIRFKHYETVEELKLENKFAAINLKIPLLDNIDDAVKSVPKVTSTLRNAFGEVYATYALSYYGIMFCPYWITNWFIQYSTSPFTLAFSNTPGLVKPLY